WAAAASSSTAALPYGRLHFPRPSSRPSISRRSAPVTRWRSPGCRTPAEPPLDELAGEHPGLPVLGGLASAGSGPGATVLMHDGQIASEGAVGVVVTGADIRPCVSQGARPI